MESKPVVKSDEYITYLVGFTPKWFKSGSDKIYMS